MRPLSISELLTAHTGAADDFAARANAIPGDRWDVPRAPGKWTPAQEAKHLVLGYGAYIRELHGEPTFRLKGRWWQRRLWRWTFLPRILASGQIMRAVRAPREVRPPDAPGDQTTLIAEFHSAIATFDTAVREVQHESPGQRVRHPYFGALTLTELVRFCTVHIRHHAAFLPDADPGRAG
ncbi:MAG TPA: DinB family protein [Gemmatimonadaceae bacterium]